MEIKGSSWEPKSPSLFLSWLSYFPSICLNNRYEMTVQNVDIRMFRNVVGHADVHIRLVNNLIIFVIRTRFFIFKTVLRIFKVDSPNEQVICLLSSLRLLACRLLASCPVLSKSCPRE